MEARIQLAGLAVGSRDVAADVCFELIVWQKGGGYVISAGGGELDANFHGVGVKFDPLLVVWRARLFGRRAVQ